MKDIETFNKLNTEVTLEMQLMPSRGGASHHMGE